MHKMVRMIVCLLAAPMMLFASYSDNDKTRMIADLDIVKNEIQINYAPLDWKRSILNWDLDREILAAQEKILTTKNLTPRQYQQIIRDFFNSTQDLHVGVDFYSTELAVLPFLVQGVQGRYFVIWRDDDWADSQSTPLQVGDEILSFNGQPLAEIIQEIQRSAYGSGDSETYQHLSELQLTVREGNFLHHVPQGQVEVIYKTKQENTDSLLVEWIYVPEEIDNYFSRQFSYEHATLGKDPFFRKSRSLPLYSRLKNHNSPFIERKKLMGGENFLPPLGTVTWKSPSKHFNAYVYTLKGKSIGYIYIPDFHADTEEAEEFRKIVAAMEGRTQALIIDVMNNPGGYAFHAYALASILTDKPLKNLKERLTITQEDVYFAVQKAELLTIVDSNDDATDILGTDICGYQVDKIMTDSILKLAHFIKDQFKQGKYFTDPYPMEGLEYISPNSKTHYTKPLYVLTNSMSISCGDFLPALLQDNKRAKILGCQTAGAGGYVLSKNYSNRFGVANFTLTGSLMYRLDGSPLENRGVKPDFTYEFTVKDFTNNFEDFIHFVNNTVSEKQQR